MGTPRGPVPPSGTPAYKYTPAMRNSAPGAPGQAVHIQGQEPLSASALAAAHPSDQKQMLGERLFPLIQVRSHFLLFFMVIIYSFAIFPAGETSRCCWQGHWNAS